MRLARRCLVLLDNVSEPGLLSEAQLAVLPDEAWFHLAVTTRLGVGDLGAAGARGSVAMIEVGRLAVEDAVALIREHQPARDVARLHHESAAPPSTTRPVRWCSCWTVTRWPWSRPRSTWAAQGWNRRNC